MRARIVLACAEPGVVYEQVAADLGVTTMTVGKWRGRFARARLAGLDDGEGPGWPEAGLVLTDAERDQLTRWSRRAKSSRVLALRSKIVLACAQGVLSGGTRIGRWRDPQGSPRRHGRSRIAAMWPWTRLGVATSSARSQE